MNPPAPSAPPRFAARIGLDWGDRQHALALRPGDSSTLETSTLDHSAESVRAWLQQIEQRFGGRPVALALETSKGPLIHLFFDVPWLTVYPIHPATSARIRKAFTPSGAKDGTLARPVRYFDYGRFPLRLCASVCGRPFLRGPDRRSPAAVPRTLLPTGSLDPGSWTV
jgi:hypothetical protein